MRPAKYLLLFLGVFVIIPNKLIAKAISSAASSEEEDYLTVLSAWFYSAFDIDSSDSSESNETYLICRNCTVILSNATESRPTSESTKVAASTVASAAFVSKETTPATKSIANTTPMAGKATTAVAGKVETTTGATGATMTTAKA